MVQTAADSTRARLLDAAGQTFAEKGFDAATVRDICEAAGANVASINYHFGDKRKLYEEVLSSIFSYATEKYPADFGQADAATPEERLYAFVRAFLLRRLDPLRPAWHRKLMAREVHEPTPHFRTVIEQAHSRGRTLLRQILAELFDPGADPESLDLCAASIVGQCLFYQHGRHVVSPVLRRITAGPAGIDRLARHITLFSLGGLARATADRSEKPLSRTGRATCS